MYAVLNVIRRLRQNDKRKTTDVSNVRGEMSSDMMMRSKCPNLLYEFITRYFI